MKKPFAKSRQQLFVDDPIYTQYDLADVKSGEITKFFRGEGSVDAYCLACRQRSVLRIPGIGYGFDDEKNAVQRFGVIVIEASCQRDSTEPYLDRCAGKLIACFWRDGDFLTKIGQYPSKADLEFGQDDPVLKELDERLRREFGTAVGLHAHGVGIGAFVYLRRIFEHLVEEAHTEAFKEPEWDEDSYARSRMPEKVHRLADHLPTRLLQSTEIYPVLSKGIHELSEEECRAYFDLLRTAIHMILSERHENEEYQRMRLALGQAIEGLKTNGGGDEPNAAG